MSESLSALTEHPDTSAAAAPELSCKTRGNSSPQGKPRIYFTCHPRDFDACFAFVSGLILERQNCAIWYRTDPGESFAAEEDMALTLGQMQLFVMPVTTRLLTEPNDAMDVEFPFAVARHIPVLPFMREHGLDSLFTKRFGDLQYLDPDQSDATAISFDEKLDKYLNNVLTGDALAAKIRAAFDAYIFLSYRKKDRKYAQSLMRLIHTIPACRDIAIWYDEYLTPGENFNDAIADALQKSDLFALVVTPNLINETNYVLTTEYPMAREAGKIVLPVEMAATDRKMLHDKYDALPECLPGRRNVAFDEEFLKAVRTLALAESDDTPEHNFFIGLAYLDGIDVEVDNARALPLITGAAENGLPEAIEKLVSMYHDGKGVARDYKVSVKWQERLVAELRKGNDKAALFNAIMLLGDACLDMGLAAEAETAYRELPETAQALEQEGYKDAQHGLLTGYNKLGHIAKARKHPDEARDWYEKSLAIAKAFAEETETARARRDLSVCYDNLGDVEITLGHPDKARHWYEESLAIAEALAEETGTAKARRDLAVSYSNLGDVENTLGHPDKARDWYEACLDIRAVLAEEVGTAAARRELSVSYNDLGNIEDALGHPDRARRWYEKSLAIREALAEETGTVEARRDLSVNYGHLGDLENASGHPDKAGCWYEKSLAIAQALLEETGMTEVRRDLAISYDNLGDAESASGHPDLARRWYEKCLAVKETLAKETGTVEARRDLAIGYSKLGDIEAALGAPETAKEWYEKNSVIIRALAEETNTMHARRDLAISYSRLGDAERALGNPEAAEEWYRKSLPVEEALAKETGTAPARRSLSVNYGNLGAVENALGHPDRARDWYGRSAAIRETLAKETDTAEAWRDLSYSYGMLGNTEVDLGHPDKGREWFAKALEIEERRAELTGDTSFRDILRRLSQPPKTSEEPRPVQKKKGLFSRLFKKS